MADSPLCSASASISFSTSSSVASILFRGRDAVDQQFRLHVVHGAVVLPRRSETQSTFTARGSTPWAASERTVRSSRTSICCSDQRFGHREIVLFHKRFENLLARLRGLPRFLLRLQILLDFLAQLGDSGYTAHLFRHLYRELIIQFGKLLFFIPWTSTV